jgi:hypothetical protein
MVDKRRASKTATPDKSGTSLGREDIIEDVMSQVARILQLQMLVDRVGGT